MTRYYRIPEIPIQAGPNVPVLDINPEDAAMGGVPGWKMLIDPAYRYLGGVRNRVKPRNYMVPRNADTQIENPVAASTFPNSQPAFDITTSARAMPSCVAINPTAWSFFAVLHITSISATLGRNLITPKDSGLTGFSPVITIRSAAGGNTLAVYGNGIVGTLRANGPVMPDNLPCLTMVTFSVDAGMHMFLNGTQVYNSPSKTEPLTAGFGANDYYVYEGNSGTGFLHAGMTGLLDIDLSTTPNAAYRQAIENFLIDKYDIS